MSKTSEQWMQMQLAMANNLRNNMFTKERIVKRLEYLQEGKPVSNLLELEYHPLTMDVIRNNKHTIDKVFYRRTSAARRRFNEQQLRKEMPLEYLIETLQELFNPNSYLKTHRVEYTKKPLVYDKFFG